MKVFRRNGRWISVLCIDLILLAGCSDVASHTDPAAQPNQPEQARSFLTSFSNDFLNWPERIIDDSGDVILAPDNLTALLLAGGGSIALHNTDVDKRVAGHFDKHRILPGFVDESVDIIGNPGTHFAATVLWYGLAAEAGDEFNKQRAWTMTTALAVTGLATVGLKLIRDNHTPNGKRFAWPSGHTASSVTVAAVLDEFYGPKIGIPAYAVAGFVGFRMMDSGDHWASDVLFGAVLGWVVGHTVAGKHKNLELAGFEVTPYFAANRDSSAFGLTLVKQF